MNFETNSSSLSVVNSTTKATAASTATTSSFKQSMFDDHDRHHHILMAISMECKLVCAVDTVDVTSPHIIPLAHSIAADRRH
ncbi:hypothetical protein RDWZM_006020 [Blomia tropicalis]|uniref:Uncharacterized protein n=1 Tax=Blomia tropicalis TaxID=40697 RepID=A0A9Q0RLD4_BLOTA|nr:hypothetical protein RDWZM_006020 [Blomia tropicalis]